VNKLEKKALKRILKTTEHPSVPGVSYDENFKRTKEPDLVDGVKNTDLLSDPKYEAGYKHCYSQIRQLLFFLLTAEAKDLKKFAGS
jgi:hypothetical protein